MREGGGGMGSMFLAGSGVATGSGPVSALFGGGFYRGGERNERTEGEVERWNVTRNEQAMSCISFCG